MKFRFRHLLLSLLAAGLVLSSRPLIVEASIQSQDWAYAVFPVQEGFQEYSSPYGMRTHPISGMEKMHWGLDIAAKHGSPIHSWWAGKVTEIGNDPGGWGDYVVVVSGNWESLYAHCSKIVAKEGQEVKAGDTVALVGMTGGATGDHLHWELKFLPTGERIDPMRLVKAMYRAHKGD